MIGEEDNFKKWKVGDSESLKHIIEKKDLDDFAKLTGDDNPLHMDETYAAKTSFGQRVVHGMLSASFISTIIGTKLPGKGALWISQTLDFHAPARIGDNITVTASIKNKSESQRILSLDIEIKNQHNIKLITGKSLVKAIEFFRKRNK